MNQLDTWQLVALAAALGWASGIRLYTVLFVVGAVGYAGWFDLPEHLRILSHPMVLAASGFMVFGESPPAWTLAAAILGGTLAAGSHFTKAGARMLINTSPEPFSNWAASFGEDLLAGTLIYFALAYPVVALIVVAVLVVLSIWLIPKLWRFMRAIVERIERVLGGGHSRSHEAEQVVRRNG